ncbi:DUF2795 domain-containing protein [Amycolatopsis minnesotensis]|uniref:DUF2795 domain-containing protein n=1 Tax=Amycolatopsis minnesotensis TaxID=337894 RepID=A0ABN2S369_9PSEU
MTGALEISPASNSPPAVARRRDDRCVRFGDAGTLHRGPRPLAEEVLMTDFDEEQLRTGLEGLRYPCDRGELLRYAASQGAGDDLLGCLGMLPERDYTGLTSVREALAET